MHSWNALSAGDVYEQAYGTSGFYTSTGAQSTFDNRLEHVLNHVHTTLGKPWKELSDYIFAFEAENEAMIGLVCAAFSLCHLSLTSPFRASPLSRTIHNGKSNHVRSIEVECPIGLQAM